MLSEQGEAVGGQMTHGTRSPSACLSATRDTEEGGIADLASQGMHPKIPLRTGIYFPPETISVVLPAGKFTAPLFCLTNNTLWALENYIRLKIKQPFSSVLMEKCQLPLGPQSSGSAHHF